MKRQNVASRPELTKAEQKRLDRASDVCDADIRKAESRYHTERELIWSDYRKTCAQIYAKAKNRQAAQ